MGKLDSYFFTFSNQVLMEYKIIYTENGKKSHAYEFANSIAGAKKAFLAVHPNANILNIKLR